MQLPLPPPSHKGNYLHYFHTGMAYNPAGSASLARFASDGVRSFDQADIDNSTAATAAQVADNAAMFANKKEEFAAAEAAAAEAEAKAEAATAAAEAATATAAAAVTAAATAATAAAAAATTAAAATATAAAAAVALERLKTANEESEGVALKNCVDARQVTVQTAKVHLRCEFESWVRERMRLTSSVQCCSMSSLRNLF